MTADGDQAVDADTFVEDLARAFEPGEVVKRLLEMGLEYSDLALALGVHPRTVRAWVADGRDASRQRDSILSLKSVVVFLLRRGILPPKKLAMWLVEPNADLQFRRPLSVLAEDRINDVIQASAEFVLPADALPDGNPQEQEMRAGVEQAAAAGAVGRSHRASGAS